MPFYNKLRSEKPEDRRTAERLLHLKAQMDAEVPKKDLDRHLLVATWNLREFGAAKYGERTRESLYYIAEVMSHFDLIAVQEVRSDLKALDQLMDILGQSMWKYIVSDVTQGKQGNDERLAFIYDTRKLSFGGLAGEIVPEQTKKKDGLLAADSAYARSPYMVGFRAGWFRFSICTSHAYYGKGAKDPQRIKEMGDLVRQLQKRVNDPDPWARNIIVLGDFNIFSEDDKAMESLTKAFTRPAVFVGSKKGSNQMMNKPYDQIGFISPDLGYQLDKANAGIFNMYQSVYREEGDEGLYPWDKTNVPSFREWRSYQMSDHLPMWVELKVDFADEYLTGKSRVPAPKDPAPAAKKAAAKRPKKKAAKPA
ncbi:MAG: endonuclease/exonuclease/phosphatase family protein [Prosthecobacter sp.]|uniref:endonuclease/exonuclease/phosphatase family protein n=1 Tax=Prosthecobacter sp. TaxID=1965333 RepID=UPI0038FE087A